MSEHTETLTSEFSDLVVRLDARSGAPVGLRSGGNDLEMSTTVAIEIGGREERATMGGLRYPGAQIEHPVFSDRVSVQAQLIEGGRSFTVTAPGDGFTIVWTYVFRATFPRLSMSVEVVRTGPPVIVRNVSVQITASVASEDWVVHAPGGKFRANLPLAQLERRSYVSPIGGVLGSTGLVALERPSTMTFVLWPMQTDTIGDLWLENRSGGVHFEVVADRAGYLDSGDSLTVDRLLVDLTPESFDRVLDEVPRALAAQGIVSAGDAPEWGRSANLYEVQIGYSVFHGGYRYEPYPQVSDLIADLDRIAGLGFTALQIMPRHPYPSYNVADYSDISVSYGDERELRRLIELAHARGMHVILDILLHGVIDQQIMATAIEAVESGVYADRMDETVGDITVLEPDEEDPYGIAWARHLLDFGPHWSAGSPHRHPLRDEHPEWFVEDSSGETTGIYTNAFDVSHPGWQQYFIDSCADLIRRLDADGFRFDAPTYNYFMNWSARTRRTAHISMLGCVPLFERLRRDLRLVKPDILLYTEPSGVLFRRDMHVNYNYDEQWLVRAITSDTYRRSHWVRSGAELSQWLEHRDRALPTGSLTAHHVDSHDTFWWPSPGGKWRREQFGIARTAALMCIFALRGEPYMTFVGGEHGMEAEVSAINHARLDHPVLAIGDRVVGQVTISDDRAYAVLLESSTERALVLVNTTDEPFSVRVTLPGLDRESVEELDLTATRWADQGAVESFENGVLIPLAAAGVRILLLAHAG